MSLGAWEDLFNAQNALLALFNSDIALSDEEKEKIVDMVQVIGNRLYVETYNAED